jgi:hypothetical protein
MADKQIYDAYKFSMSPRGEYIISQALVTAIKQLKTVPDRQREDSNIADMEYLLEKVYPLFKIQEEMSVNETQLKALQGVLDIAQEAQKDAITKKHQFFSSWIHTKVDD